MQNIISEERLHSIIMESINKMMNEDSGIHIDPKNKGKFTATKERTGKSTEELTHSKNPLTRKRAVFALNAKKWHHKGKKATNEATQLNMFGPAEEIPEKSNPNKYKTPENAIEQQIKAQGKKWKKEEDAYKKLAKHGIHQAPMFPEDK